ncbi:MAG TPA: cytochrome c biogenesis protein CcsA [Myxococcales bacterium]|nr:cytochrome c biogenesis protein CcsA [Myxococcales bacterium]
MVKAIRYGLPVVGALMMASGSWLGLSWVPAERDMGDVARIMYVHVPAVWMMLLCSLLNFGASLWYLFKASWVADALAEAGAEISLVFGTIGVLLGSIWARPTWGVYWNWDPRLTSVTIMLVTYAGYLALRRFVDDPDKRAARSAVVGILAFVNAPLVWFSVKWFNSLHQVQSSPRTTYPELVLTLRWNSFAFLFIAVWFVWQRYELAMLTRAGEVAPPEPPAVPAGGAA